MDKAFLSSKNVSKLVESFEKHVGTNKKYRPKIKEFLLNNMKSTYSKYGNKKPSNISSTDFLNILNKKSLKNSIEIYKSKTSKQPTNPPPLNQINQYERDREKQVYGDRKLILEDRPQFSGLKDPKLDTSNQFPDQFEGYTGADSLFTPLSMLSATETNAPSNVSRQDRNILNDRNIPMNTNNTNLSMSRGSSDDLDKMMKARLNDYKDLGMMQSTPPALPPPLKVGKGGSSQGTGQISGSGGSNIAGQGSGSGDLGELLGFDTNFYDNNFIQGTPTDQLMDPSSFASNPLNEEEMKANFNRMLNERNNIDTPIFTPPNPSPLPPPSSNSLTLPTTSGAPLTPTYHSPHPPHYHTPPLPQQNDNYLETIFKTLNNDEIDAYIELLQKKLLTSELEMPEIDPYILANMSLDELNIITEKLQANTLEITLPPITKLTPKTPEPIPPKVSSPPPKTTENITLKVDPSTITTPEHYNKYLIELEEEIDNVTEINLKSIEFMDNLYNIPDSTFECKLDDNEIVFTVDKGLYTIDSILALLNNRNIGLKFKYTNRRIIINSIGGENFSFISNTTSILYHLGFTNKKYQNKNTYKAEKEAIVQQNNAIQLYIENTHDIENLNEILIADINLENGKIENKNTKFSNMILNDFIIKFKYNGSNLFDFRNIKHKMSLNIVRQA